MKLSPPPSIRSLSRYVPVLLVLGLLWLVIELVARLGVEMLWFAEVGYLSMYLLRLQAQIWLGLGVFGIAMLYLWGNLILAQRLKSPYPTTDNQAILANRYLPIDRQQIPAALSLRWLLVVTIGLSLCIGAISIHYLQVAIGQVTIDPTLPKIAPPAPVLLHPELVWHWLLNLTRNGFSTTIAAALAMMAGAILIYPRWWLRSLSIMLSLAIAWVYSRQWLYILPLFQATPFNERDPVFDRDISTYIFGLPVVELLEFGLMGICLYGFISVLLTYLLSGDSLSQGRFIGFSPAQQRHLCAVGGAVMLIIGLSYAISCFELLYSPRGVSFGASYTDITIQLPADRTLSVLAVAIAGYLFWRSLSYARQPIGQILGLYLGVAIAATAVLPFVFQALIVQPNELAQETPYLKRTIAFTRQAFGLNEIAAQTFNPEANLTAQKIADNEPIVSNIRLWDEQPLLATNRQLQQIRLYYRFPDADIDRYNLAVGNVKQTPQQVLISARELDFAAVPKQAQTWVNQHLIYTHGYGFTVSPVNRVATGGLPEYLVKDIGTTGQGRLNTASAAVRANIPIGEPRIYYGENANSYVMTGTKVKELDYPSGNDNTYNTYDGRGGIDLNSSWRRMLFAKYLNDWRLAITPEFKPETKILIRRNIARRVRSIAPFLRFDRDPYLVAADTDTNSQNPSYLYWIADAYTTSDRYPYADTGSEGINYIRNSVKLVIDAYNGSVKLYIADPSDPIVTTWAKIFPDLFQPLSAMPANLRAHIRYPEDIFQIQSQRLMTYHMTDPQVFYNREDQWQVPNEVYGNKLRLVKPYYLITSLPTIPAPEFTLLLPYTPQQRTNMVAWLAARSDGENYGKLLLYDFPKERLIFGPEQIEARINQDPTISAQISLWNRQGSRVLQGNLLIVPIDRSLLYVEPIYIEATQNQIPTLARVVVAYENRIVMAESLSKALAMMFESPTPTPTTAS